MTDAAHFIASTETFLRVTAERRLRESQDFLADRVEFVYPNGIFHDIAEVFAAGERRYRWIRKRHDSWDVVEKDDGTVVVVSVGTLYGENNHGQSFGDVRYVDRITFADNRIVRQQVWNDLAESGVLGAPAASNVELEPADVQHEQEKR
jgi:hypothetical protein